jgi:hypothetical protein
MPEGAKPGLPGANPEREAAADVAHAVPERIYSASDVDVTPPEYIASREDGRPAGDGSAAGEMVLVIVDEQGAVESVKATIPPRTVAESILQTAALHIIKAQQFRPALRDGSPVRYRAVMSVGSLGLGLSLGR